MEQLKYLITETKTKQIIFSFTERKSKNPKTDQFIVSIQHSFTPFVIVYIQNNAK